MSLSPKVLRATAAALCLAVAAPWARAQSRPMDASVALGIRAVLASPSGRELRASNPGLERLFDPLPASLSPTLLRALGPLEGSLPAQARQDLIKGEGQNLAAAVAKALEDSRPAGAAELNERVAEAAKIASESAATAQRLPEIYGELSAYDIYGERAEARLRQFALFGERAGAVLMHAKRMFVQSRVQAMAHVLMESAPEDLGPVSFGPLLSALAAVTAHEAPPAGPAKLGTTSFGAPGSAQLRAARLVHSARDAVFAVNPRGEAVFTALMSAAEQGKIVSVRRADGQVPTIVVDGKQLVEYGDNFVAVDQAPRGKTVLATGYSVKIDAEFARKFRFEAVESLLRLAPARRVSALKRAWIMPILVSGISVASSVPVMISMMLHPSWTLNFILAGLMAAVLWLIRSQPGRVVREAARNGWFPGQGAEQDAAVLAQARAAAGTPRATSAWERILDDTSWSQKRPYYVRLGNAFDAMRRKTPPPEEALRFIAAAGSDTWRPFLRETHLDVLWNFMRSETPATALAAAKLVASLNPYFVAASIAGDAGPWNIRRLEKLLPGDACVAKIKEELARRSAERPRAD